MSHTEKDLVLCRSNTGDGGWSLHLGDNLSPLTFGPAEWIEENDLYRGHWSRPNKDDIEDALRVANREEDPNCIWRDAETPVAKNH